MDEHCTYRARHYHSIHDDEARLFGLIGYTGYIGHMPQSWGLIWINRTVRVTSIKQKRNKNKQWLFNEQLPWQFKHVQTMPQVRKMSTWREKHSHYALTDTHTQRGGDKTTDTDTVIPTTPLSFHNLQTKRDMYSNYTHTGPHTHIMPQ